MKKNIVWHDPQVSREMRQEANGHRSAVLWFTGLSGAGKSTLAHAVEERLYEMGVHTYVLDGDNVRHGLCGDLGFSDVARRENIRRIGEAAKLFVDAGVVVLTAFISPFRSDRQQVRKLLGKDFIEIFCNSPLDVCESRDVKGLYQRARSGEIKDFTGISSPYEEPEAAEIVVDTGSLDIEEAVHQVVGYLTQHHVVTLAD